MSSLPHNHGNKDNIQKLQSSLSNDSRFEGASEVFKQLGDTTRMKIFWLLCHREECVINIAYLMGMSSPAVSHHLKPLKESGLIVSRRDGKEVYYSAARNEEGVMLHKIVEKVMEISCPKNGLSESKKDTVLQVHEYLTQHLNERITTAELAKRFLINTTTLKKEFKAVYGMSIALHIKIHRLEKAAELLKENNLSIGEIASLVGYESQSKFTAAFKEMYGVSPKEYRKMYNY